MQRGAVHAEVTVQWLKMRETDIPAWIFIDMNMTSMIAATRSSKKVGVSSAIPVTCFFDRDGQEIHQQLGTMTQEELDSYLKRISH